MHSHHHPHHYNFAFFLAVLLNSLFIVVELIYAYFANSMSLFADAGHNLGDILGLGLAWLANWLLSRNTSEKYSYGYKKTTILASLANALLLVLTSAVIASEAIERVITPSAVNEKIIMIVAGIGIVINGITALPFLKGSAHDLNLKAAFIHLLADALISLGVVFSGIVIYFTGKDWIDPVTSLIIVVTILISTWGILRDSLNLILAAVPHTVDINQVKTYLKTLPGVKEIHDLHVWSMSTHENALTVHLVMPQQRLTDQQYKTIAATLKEQYLIHHVTIQVEEGDHKNACDLCETC